MSRRTALAPITLPSVHQCSLNFCSPALCFAPSVLTLYVVIRLVGELSTVSVLLILTVMPAKLLPLFPPDTWFRSGGPQSGVLLLENPLPHHDVSFLSVNIEHRLWPQTFSIQMLPVIVPFPFSLAPPPLYCFAWLTLCLGFTGISLLLIWSSVCF